MNIFVTMSDHFWKAEAVCVWKAVCAKKVGVAQVKVVQVQGAKLLEAVPKFEYARQMEAAHVEWVRTSRVRRVQRLVVRGRL